MHKTRFQATKTRVAYFPFNGMGQNVLWLHLDHSTRIVVVSVTELTVTVDTKTERSFPVS